MVRELVRPFDEMLPMPPGEAFGGWTRSWFTDAGLALMGDAVRRIGDVLLGCNDMWELVLVQSEWRRPR